MCRIPIFLKFIDLINKSWHLLQAFDWNLLFRKSQWWQISHSFDALALLIPSEGSTLLNYSICNIQAFIQKYYALDLSLYE